MRAVVYPRVSSAAQRDRHTIASQLRALPEFVAARGWQLVRPAGHYVDDGRTAKAGHLEQREAFRRLLADAAAGVFDVVVLIGLDRLTRAEDMTERGAILGAFQRAGVKIALAATGQVLNLSSSMDDLMAFIGAPPLTGPRWLPPNFSPAPSCPCRLSGRARGALFTSRPVHLEGPTAPPAASRRP